MADAVIHSLVAWAIDKGHIYSGESSELASSSDDTQSSCSCSCSPGNCDAALMYENPIAFDARRRRSIEEEIRDKVFHPVALDDFVHNVWGLDRATIRRIHRHRRWPFLRSLSYPDEDDPSADEMISHFDDIFEDLLSEVRQFLGSREQPAVIFCSRLNDDGKIAAMNSALMARKPSMFTVPEVADKLDWLMPWHIIEFADGDLDMPPFCVECDRSRHRRPYSQGHLQLALSARECLGISTRHFISGIFLSPSGNFSLWYFDTCSVIRTADLDFLRDPASLALAVYAVSICDVDHSGADPFMITPRVPSQQGVTRIIGSRLIFPHETPSGRLVSYTIAGVIHEDFSLIGRRTKVYRVLRGFKNMEDYDLDDEVEVLKLSWPYVWRYSEAAIIRRLVDALPGWKDHLPEVVFSGIYTAEYLELPRVQLLKTVSTAEFEDRELRAITMKLYKHLWEVDSVEEFVNVFIDCVECHYHAYFVAEVLHSDLSESNLMFKRKRGVVKGILNDWDMASIVNERRRSFKWPRATGTLPFMARDLLLDDPPPHLYQHDLESFFYILVWAAIHYDFKAKTKGKTIRSMERWEVDRSISLRAKEAFITDDEESEVILSYIRPEMKDLVYLIDRVLRLFREASGDQSSDGYTGSGRYVSFRSFMKALGRRPRHL